MKISRRREVRQKAGPIPKTWGETLRLCPFRSFIGIGAGDVEEMTSRIAHAFATIGGEVFPIGAETLDEMAASVRAGGVVLIVSDRADLRDAAKREILARVYGAVGSA